MRHTRLFVTIALAGSTLLAACGGGDATADDAPDGGGTSTVTLRDNAFAPADPVITAGSVELVNEGASPHTFTIEGEDIDVEVAAGETTTATVDLPEGTYTLFCNFHRAQGMEGTLTVQA